MSTEPSVFARSFSASAPETGCSIRRATPDDQHRAFELVQEYSEPVGCIALHPLASPVRSGEIKRLYVKQAYRRQGLAERLLNALEEFAAKTAGYEWLYLDTKDDLVTAIRFYELRGYKRCERYNSNPQATIFMRKGLNGLTD